MCLGVLLQPGKARFDQQLCFRSGDEHSRVHLEFQAKKRLLSRQVSQGFSGAETLQQRFDLPGLSGCEVGIAMGNNPGLGLPQHMGNQREGTLMGIFQFRAVSWDSRAKQCPQGLSHWFRSWPNVRLRRQFEVR